MRIFDFGEIAFGDTRLGGQGFQRQFPRQPQCFDVFPDFGFRNHAAFPILFESDVCV